MIRNYLKIAFRNFKRFKVYTAINLLGLSMGLGVSVLMLLFILDELSYDQFHSKKDRIYRVETDNPEGGTMETNAWPIATKLKDEYPEVEKIVYARQAPSNMMVNYEGKRYQHNMHYAGKDFFSIFSFEFLEGNPEDALAESYSIVITEEIKNRYFGNEVVLGKSLLIRDSLDFKITGVIKNVPQQSHIQFDLLASFKTYEKLTDWFSYSEGWGNFNVRNYILLRKGVNVNELSKKVAPMYMDNVGDWLKEMGMYFNVKLEPLNDVYLKSNAGNGFGLQGSMDRVYLVAGIAAFVLLLACINFINLTTARSIYRAKEVGLRKIVGSSRSVLIWQFMSEAFIFTFIAFIIGAILIDLVLPFFNELMGKQFELSSLFTWEMLFGTAVLIVFITLFSGYYPSLVLSGYQPVEVLKGSMNTSAKGVKLRRALVVFQFFISCLLVLASITVVQQLDYMRNQELGFSKDQILVLDATRIPKSASHEAFRNALSGFTSVENVSFSNALPGRPGWLGQWAYPESIEEGQQVDTEYMAVDEHYINALGLELLAGNNFDTSVPAGLQEGLLINETTVKEMGWGNPIDAIGKKIVSPSDHPAGTVIGVVKDYHGQGLQESIWPQVMDYAATEYGRYYAIRFKIGTTSKLVKNAEEAWKDYLGDYTFEYFFLDEDFDRQYKSEDRLMTGFCVFAGLTLVIAMIGLLGLVSFMVLSKTKEIGIRKILGANIISLTSMMTREFALLVLVANLLVIPIVWYYGEQWLSSFAYHMEFNPAIFILSTIITIAMAIITVSFQTIKAAQANPITTLRNQ